MKQSFLLLVISGFIVTGCQNRNSKKIFQPEALASQLVTFDISRDTSFKTKHGAIIRIPKGSLQSAEGTVVQLEIKEAYSIGEMVRAGLATQSNGQPLTSAGLIYIDVVGENKIRISKPVSIAIPSPFIDDSMKLFKGELNRDSNMNWIDPKPMSDNPQMKALQAGRALFINNCASCHAIDKRGLGPDLAHIIKRSKPIPFGEEGYVQNGYNLLYDFTKNNQAILKWSLYYRCLYNQYNKMPMNIFPDLTETDLNNLYAYIENESEVRKLPVPDNGIEKCLDSCLLYAEAKRRLKQMKSGFEGDSSEEAGDNINFSISRPDTSKNKRVVVTRAPMNHLADLENVDPVRNKPLYYQFNIETFGWYNIDKFLKADYGSAESLLLVRIKGTYNAMLNVYLVIPSSKVVAEGNILDQEKNTYGFYTKDGTIYLPQNTRAYILAMNEERDSISFAKKEFIITSAQYFDLDLSKVPKNFFNEQMRSISASDLTVQVKDTRTGAALRKKIKEITNAEDLKPKNCDCGCFMNQPVDAILPNVSKGIKDKKDTVVVVKDSIITPKVIVTEPRKENKIIAPKTEKRKTTTAKRKVQNKKKKKKTNYKSRVAKR